MDRTAFLAYASTDGSFARSFGQALTQQGIGIVGSQQIVAGDAWASTLREKLERVDAVVLIVPEAGHGGANSAFFEAGAAFRLGKLVFAVVPHNDRSRLDNLPSDLIRLGLFNPGERPGFSADVIAREIRALDQQAA